MANSDSAPGYGPDAPPPYISPTVGPEHRFKFLGRDRKQWGSLALTSAARSARSSPLFFGGDRVRGTFELADSESMDSIRSITVSVVGSIVTGPLVDDTAVFLKLPTVLWSRKALSAHTERIWPFSIPLPGEVNIRGASYALPESFLERHTRVSVIYEISIVVSRGLFRPNTTSSTRFRYVPCTQPGTPSLLRQRAYARSLALPGPTEDFEGWQTFVTVMSHGHVFKSRQAVVQCTLSLATPHCYTRGSPIPCWLTLESGDLQALDFFADPAAVRVRLRRCIRYQGMALSMMPTSVDAAQEFTDVASAVWWERPSDTDGAHRRTLEGEIHVPGNVVATARVDAAQFSVTYTVELLPSASIQFTPTTQSPLLSVPVTIATMYPTDAPRPIGYAPPSYDGSGPSSESRTDAMVYTQITGIRR
ncbi:hypothetical protein C8R46DRAFT_889265 [Mycena filopes]|nr:hypothetical protein C8R46DRAFT_889265 [Mycena filopes]